jgi:hypothetical protein
MALLTQKQIDKEFEFLEKQKSLLKEEREKIMIERGRLYYEWKEIQETSVEIEKEKERINSLWANLGTALDEVNNEYTRQKEIEIAKIRKEKEDLLEAQLTEDRKRLDKLRMELAEQIAIEEAMLKSKKAKNLI